MKEEKIEVKKDGMLYPKYIVPPSHCGTVKIHFYLDNNHQKSHKYEINNFNYVKKELGLIRKGTYTLALEAERKRGGCNKGKLNSWGGAVNLHILPKNSGLKPPLLRG
ncbi:MAG: hypothetical protein F6K39_38190 [Okeania sp. SIO3B3]|nr:hypothetical protein [Okeania sp. SIO3B3]